ncbi:MAG: glycosyltransferase family 2 protein [Alphaproteobacteria bacterium]
MAAPRDTAGVAPIAPRLSVVIPVHDAGPLLDEALASVAAQGMSEIEVLVVDDGSSDDPGRHLSGRPFPTRFFRQENRGPAAARNVGLRAARAEMIAFLDADDIWPRGALAALIERMEAAPHTDIAQGHLRNFRRATAAENEWPATIVGQARIGFNLGAALFRRQAFERTGPFDEVLRTSEDVDIWVRMQEAGLVRAVIPATTLMYRRGNSGIMERMPPDLRAATHHRQWARIIHANLARRRERAD